MKVYAIHKTDHGVDGFDAKTNKEVFFTTLEKAFKWLKDKKHTVNHDGSKIDVTKPINNKYFYHEKQEKRWCMGCITYQIKEEYIVIDPDESEPEKNTPFDWDKKLNYKIVDWDGFSDLKISDLITEKEFKDRAANCTVEF